MSTRATLFQTFAAGALIAVANPAPSTAQTRPAQSKAAAPQYTAEDVVRTFGQPTANLGASRGLCIGTESECQIRNAAPVAAATPKFDLLITFEYNSEELTAAARRNLDEFATALQTPELTTRRFEVEGHTDGQGSQEYNLGLSERRAAAVVRYLEGKGVSDSKLTARGYGKLRPRVADQFDPSNRRVEARLAE